MCSLYSRTTDLDYISILQWSSLYSHSSDRNLNYRCLLPLSRPKLVWVSSLSSKAESSPFCESMPNSLRFNVIFEPDMICSISAGNLMVLYTWILNACVVGKMVSIDVAPVSANTHATSIFKMLLIYFFPSGIRKQKMCIPSFCILSLWMSCVCFHALLLKGFLMSCCEHEELLQRVMERWHGLFMDAYTTTQIQDINKQ